METPSHCRTSSTSPETVQYSINTSPVRPPIIVREPTLLHYTVSSFCLYRFYTTRHDREVVIQLGLYIIIVSARHLFVYTPAANDCPRSLFEPPATTHTPTHIYYRIVYVINVFFFCKHVQHVLYVCALSLTKTVLRDSFLYSCRP